MCFELFANISTYDDATRRIKTDVILKRNIFPCVMYDNVKSLQKRAFSDAAFLRILFDIQNVTYAMLCMVTFVHFYLI